MAEKYPSQNLPDQTTRSEDQSEPMEDQCGLDVDQCGPKGHPYGLAVDQSEPMGDQQVADHTDPDPDRMLITDQISALQYAQKTGAANVTFIENQYNVSGGQTIRNVDNSGQAQPNTLDMSKETATFNLHECQEELRAFYLEETGKVNLLPWIPEESKEMENIFVDLELMRKGESKALENMKSNEELVTLKTNQGQRINRVLIMGGPGSGKSTTSDNLAYKWALNDSQSALSKFTLVFLIRMKDIEDSNSTLVDLIFQYILTEESSVSKEGLRMYFKEKTKDILFIIDGMDEYCSSALKNKSTEITQLLHNRKMRKSCVILTTRPRNIGDLGMYASHYTQVKLEGFSVKNINRYILKFFRDDQENVDLLFRKLEAEPHIFALASIPVLLLMICLLWEDQRITPKTKTHVYQKTTRYLWLRYKSRMGEESTQYEDSDNEEFDEELTELLHKLGVVALSNTRLGWVKYIFTVQEFGRDVCDLGCQVGLLKREHSRAGIERKTSVTFLHITFQEFCAAFYLAYLLNTKQKALHDFEGTIFSLGEDAFICERNVLEFCCGIQPAVTASFLQTYTERISQISSETSKYRRVQESIHLKLIFEGQLSYEQCSNLIPLFSSYGTEIILTDDLIPSVLYLLELYKSSATQTGFFSTIKSLEVQTGCTPWLPTLLKHTNSLHHCEVFLGVSGTKRGFDMMYKALSELPNIKQLELKSTLSIHAPFFEQSDATSLLNFLIEKRVKLAEFHLIGFMFDEKSMLRYLSCTGTSILSLALRGTLDARGQFATINNVIDNLPHLKHLNQLNLSVFQIHSAVKHLRPIISQLKSLALTSCRLREKHWKELFSFLTRAQKLIAMNLSHNLLSVVSVQALVGSLRNNHVLEALDLENTGLNDESARILARFVRGKPSINTLCLDNNPDIGHAGKYALRGLPLKRYVSLGRHVVRLEDIAT